MRIDFHGHYLPPRFFDRMQALDARHRVESFAVFGEHLAAASNRQFAAGEPAFIDQWIRDMDAAAVDLTLASVGAVQPYFDSSSDAADAARFANELLHEAVAAGRGRIGAFGSLPLPHTAAAIDEVAFCVEECGFAGVNLGCSAAGKPLDAPEFDDLWAALDSCGAMVFLHPGATPEMAVGSSQYLLAPAYCSPTEMATALCRLVAAKIPLRFPNVRVVAGITGGAVPLLAYRWDRGMRAAHTDLYEELGGVLPHLRRFWYDTSLIEDPHLYHAVRATVGVDRLVLGSDTPRAPVGEVVEAILTSDRLSDEEKISILDTNGAAAYGCSEVR
ncbi:amidohydrolase family protein [Nocardia exalbida]|uniref:amidohydrolase family protein n=1 Tax=Nocardia exalbida TaxID=290231 RepID=UPI0002EA2BC8|nr:amidohydrolase family protein [Nocardia exalbida]